MRKKQRQAPALTNKLLLLFSLLLFSGAAFSQTISGTVTDVDKNPIGNVTVHVKGTSRNALTDAAGKFNITASANDVLVFSYVGFTTQEIPLNGR